MTDHGGGYLRARMSQVKLFATDGSQFAELDLLAPDLLEIRFVEGGRITVKDIVELTAQLDRMGLAAMRRLLITLPDKELAFDLDLMDKNLLAGRPAGPVDRLMAITTTSEVNQGMARLYFLYNPASFMHRCFRSRAEAMLWLAEHGSAASADPAGAARS